MELSMQGNNYKKKNKYEKILLNISRTTKLIITNSISLFFVFIFSKYKDNISDTEKLLCINTEKLGDLALASDFLYSLGKDSTYDQKFLLIQESYVSLLDWEGMNYKVIPIIKSKYKYNLFYRLHLIQQLKSKGFKRILNITPERGWINDELSLVTAADKKLAIRKSTRYLLPWVNKYYTIKYSEFLECNYHNQYEILKKYLLKEKIQFYDNGLITQFSTRAQISENNICIAPFSSDYTKNWDINNYKRLIKSIPLHIKVVLLGNDNELMVLKNIFSSFYNVIINDKITLNDASLIIKETKLFIGNDSGFTHLAHNLGVPTIAIIGGGCYDIFFPYKSNSKTFYFYHQLDCFGCNWECIHDKKYCITEINYDNVLMKVREIMQIV